MPRFKVGDLVSIIPHRREEADGTVTHALAQVVNPRRNTEMRRISGEPVEFYVDVEMVEVTELAKTTGADRLHFPEECTIKRIRPGVLYAFHEASLEPAP